MRHNFLLRTSRLEKTAKRVSREVLKPAEFLLVYNDNKNDGPYEVRLSDLRHGGQVNIWCSRSVQVRTELRHVK